MAVTDAVAGRRAADSANIPPPQPTSRYRSPLDGPGGRGREARQDRMKECRNGFMRWRRREGPCGSHQVEARAEKWESSRGETVDRVAFGGGDAVEWVWVVWRMAARDFRGRESGRSERERMVGRSRGGG